MRLLKAAVRCLHDVLLCCGHVKAAETHTHRDGKTDFRTGLGGFICFKQDGECHLTAAQGCSRYYCFLRRYFREFYEDFLKMWSGGEVR